MNEPSEADLVHLAVTKQELKYFIACGPALAQHIPCKSLPTYCGMTKDEIIAISMKLRALADSLGIDM
ncbi:hypothetical protein [Pseudomonas asplenii]|uniref:hypothetical protein n=1 Tax=Pseudomonas asplenii TaxID=53407 RepID=UPI0006B5C030|nr:hypothetical protein [Pseudomonas fuscovaginae]